MSVKPQLLDLSDISYLVSTLNKKNFKSSVTEITTFVEKYGVEAHRHLFRCLLNHIDLSSDGKQNSSRDFHQVQLLAQEFVSLLTKPYFSTVLCHAFSSPGLKPSTLLFQQVSRVLKLARVQEVALGLGLLNFPETELRIEASQFLRGKLPDLIKSHSELYGQDSGLHDVNIEIIHTLVTHLLQSHPEEIGITREQLDIFLAALRKDFPKERVPVILSPLLYPGWKDIDIGKLLGESVSTPVHLSSVGVWKLMEEMGYYATSKPEVLQDVFASAHLDEITPLCIANCLGMMARTHTGLSDQVPLQSLTSPASSLWETEKAQEMQTLAPTWNSDVFTDVIRVLASQLDWLSVVHSFDYPGFCIKDPEGLNLIMKAFKRGCELPFPVRFLYKLWSNTEGQLCWIKMALSGGSNFSFTDYPFQEIQRDMLGLQTLTRPAWTSLDLLTVLLELSESGHFDAVMNLLNHPIKNMPDILFLGILQKKGSWVTLQTDLFLLLLPVFLSGHPSCLAVLQYAWTEAPAPSNIVRPLMLQGMCDWYMKGEIFDQTRLSHILEISHELQALALLLNGTHFGFVIDLAVLASRRDFLKLDKWLMDKIKEHQEPFVSTCVVYLKKRLQSNGDKLPLPVETIGIMLGCLQLYTGPLSSETAEIFRQLMDTCGSTIPKQSQFLMNQQPPAETGLSSLLGRGSSLGLFNLPSDPHQPSVATPSSSLAVLPVTDELSGLDDTALPPVGPVSGLPVGRSAQGLIHPGQASSASVISIRQNVIPGVDQSFSREVDDEANSYFQRLYKQAMSVEEVLEILKRLKDSPNQQERDVFICMLRNLFEEHKFFNNYPDKELQITASLFGGLIQHGLVTYLTLGTALRYVMQALQKPVTDKLFRFGIYALDKFKTRLKDYAQYCSYIAAIPHFSEFPPPLIEYVECGKREQEPPQRTGSAVGGRPVAPVSAPLVTASTASFPSSSKSLPTSAGQSKQLLQSTGATPTLASVPSAKTQAPSIANPTNIDTLLVAVETSPSFTVPPDDVQEKVAFMFNNLTLQNLQKKADEILAMVQVQHLEWLAHYMVLRRISIEPNYHNLYVAYIELHRDGEFPFKVLSETYRNIKVLLQADKGDANFSDRSLLKNLGHWLGMFTLAKSRPVLQKDLAVKHLLLEAYVRGQQDMLYVVPFVTKVLESCGQKGCVFRPPNPWTMAILGVLVEIHGLPSIKLNLKFEIEVLCKNLSLELKDISTKGALANADKLRVMQLAAPGEPPATATVQKPSFHYSGINVTSLAGLKDHLKINGDLALFQSHPTLVGFIRPAVERAVQEIIHPVVERSVKIASTTTEHIIKKDFALDPEEGRMRIAAHHMVRHLTAGMAMITCREPLYVSISGNLKQNFVSALRGVGLIDQQKVIIEKAAESVAMENTELASAFIQKTAMEKAVPEMDKRLAEEFELRKLARTEGRRYCNHHTLTYQAERMPEPLRHKVGGVTSQQARVYEEFANCVPGFLPPKQPPTKITQGYPAEEVVHILEKCSKDLQQLLNSSSTMAASSSNHVRAMNILYETLQPALHMRGDAASALLLLQRAMDGLLEGFAQPPTNRDLFLRFRESHVLVLKGLQDPKAYGPLWARKHCTRILLNAREEIKFNVDAVDLLIRAQLIDVREFDVHMAQAMENGLNSAAVHFCLRLARLYFVEEKQDCPLSQSDMSYMLETLARLAANARHPPEGLTSLLEAVQMNREQPEVSPAYGVAQNRLLSATVAPTPSDEDPPGLHEKVEYLLTEWVRLYHQPTRDSEKLYAAYLGKLHQHGMLKSDDLISRFFRISTEMCVELCYRNLNLSEHKLHNPTLARAKCYHTMDAYVKLIVVLVKHSGDASTTVTKINLLNKVLSTVAHVLVQDHDMRKTEFQQLPYHRLLTMLLQELNVPDPIFDTINFSVLQSFSNTFHNLRPARAPGFAYAWLELVAHRIMIGKLLGSSSSTQQKGWALFQQLLLDLFRFLAPFLRNAELVKSTQLLYKGTLRVLLVLLHDFPEFLCDYHFSFCDVIPPNCIQMRNLILSAFPRNMRLPDPFTPNLKVDMLPEITHAPRILTNVSQSIQPANFKKELDSYIKTRAPVTFLSQLRKHLQTSIEPGTRYNVSLMNALVLYVGMQSITYIHSRSGTPSLSTITHSSHMDIFQNLAVDLDTEGRYLFLNGIANQLRYPNSHTHYFSCVLLYLFAEANSEAIQEQITRVLLERLIVNRPHPWGLLITFIELIRNPSYKFWGHSFVHCAPEIEKLFESVARSCMQQKQGQGVSREETQD